MHKFTLTVYKAGVRPLEEVKVYADEALTKELKQPIEIGENGELPPVWVESKDKR